MTKVKIKYIDCGHEKMTTKEALAHGNDLECGKCKGKPKKGTENPSPA